MFYFFEICQNARNYNIYSCCHSTIRTMRWLIFSPSHILIIIYFCNFHTIFFFFWMQNEGDNKVLKLRFDVSQYAPEEIIVKTVDQKLLVSSRKNTYIFLNWYLICFLLLLLFQVHAKHEEKSDTKSVYREYNREFLLPKGVNPESIKSSLSKDGVLTVDAPLPLQLTHEQVIPIQQH